MAIAQRQVQGVWVGSLEVATAAELCPVSNALRGNVGITVQGEVDEG